MPCPLCGDICRCSSEEGSTASTRWQPEPDVRSDAASQESLEIEETSATNQPSPAETASTSGDGEPALEDSPGWRQEVAERLNRYHSRRKPRPPRYPSLRLRFEGDESTRVPAESSAFPQVVTSNQALALDEFAAAVHISEPLNVPDAHSVQEAAASSSGEELPNHAATAWARSPITAKIIEFPRSWMPPLPALDELAEPVVHRPRILEAPEVVPPPPALGGITIEPVQQPALEKRPGIDTPLRAAPLARRVLSAFIDDVIVAAACVLFGFIFWKLTAIRPPRLQMIGVLTGLGSVLWAAYQYLLVVYAGTTPGLRLAGLELLRFDERRVSRRLRSWRVLASFLSAVSLGMGYLWVFLDEDSLCWHDRITHTYLAPKRHEPPAAKRLPDQSLEMTSD